MSYKSLHFLIQSSIINYMVKGGEIASWRSLPPSCPMCEHKILHSPCVHQLLQASFMFSCMSKMRSNHIAKLHGEVTTHVTTTKNVIHDAQKTPYKRLYTTTWDHPIIHHRIKSIPNATDTKIVSILNTTHKFVALNMHVTRIPHGSQTK